MSNSTFTIPQAPEILNDLDDVSLDTVVENDVLIADDQGNFSNQQLADVAYSNDYDDLDNTPDLSNLVEALDDLSDVSTATVQENDVLIADDQGNFSNAQLAAVAYSGEFSDLQNIPEEVDSNFHAVEQEAHGLAVGELVRLDGANYVKAIATSAAAAEVIGIVSNVADVDNFTVQYAGRVTGLSGLTAGTVYRLSTTSAGATQTTVPETSGHVDKPVLLADTTTSAIIKDYRGQVIT
jgi:hypothetical protein